MATTHHGTNAEPSEPQGGSDFTARAYQLELFEEAKKQNSILVLGTGSGKTFISILLIRELAHQIRGSLSSGSKRTVFVVNTVPLVHQQALAIETHTALQVGKYEGSMGVDYWTDDRWKDELEKNEVLVMVAQIFQDLVLHARLPLSSVNLIIMDECHHTTGSHPMREIMRQYESLKRCTPKKCPRVLGLTACVIHRKCKKKDVKKLMKALEMAMDCALVTTTDQEEVIKYSTGPKERIICYESEEPTEYQELISAQLQGIVEDVLEQRDIELKYKKLVTKKMDNIRHIMGTLGDFCVAQAIQYEMDHFDEIEKIEDVPTVRELIVLLRDRLKAIKEYCTEIEASMSPIVHVSKKVKKLYEIFCACNTEVYGLIFVERRNTAKILYDLLLKAAEQSDNLAYVKPLYVIGSNSRLGLDIRLAELELRKQNETLNKFRNGDCNFVVSTSVLEEGVDIRKCNIVLRFDKPMNYRAYVQSRGRARALPSRYLLMVQHSDLQEMLETVEVYKEIENSLINLCHDRELPTSNETREHFAEDEYIAPYEPYGPDGPKITLNSAIPLINVYCGKLPQDKFTVLAPEVVIKTTEEGCVAEIKLPINASFKEKMSGDCMENKDLAKKSAALLLCKTLHKMNELDCNLRPAAASDDGMLDGLVEIQPEQVEAGEPEPGTKKRRQVYEREVCQAFTHCQEGMYKLYSIIIQPSGPQLTDLLIDSTKSEVSLGLICKKDLLHCPFPLYCSKWGEVEVKVEFIKEIKDQSPELIRQIEHFHKVVFETLLHINFKLFDFNSRNSGVFIVPLGKESTINLDILNQISSLPSLRAREPIVNEPQAGIFHFERAFYEDAIIYPLYPTEEPEIMFYVTQIVTELNPLSEFPDFKDLYYSYSDYYKQKYGQSISNMQQPLLLAKHLPRELNFLKKLPTSCETIDGSESDFPMCAPQFLGLKKLSSKKKSRKHERDYAKFVPELCGVLPLKASVWWQVMCIPSILHRLNSLNLAYQLNVVMNDSRFIQNSDHKKINLNWPEEIIKRIRNSSKQNLCVSLLERKNDYIHPFAIVQALTLRGSNDNFDLERLEVLGDSFLKFITAEYLFLKEIKNHEGRLSMRRGKLVCNSTLYSLAKSRAIPEKIQSVNLSPPTNGFLPGFMIKPEVDKQFRSCSLAHSMWSNVPELSEMDHMQQMVENLEISENEKSKKKVEKSACYNPWSEHLLADKNIADSVEALIGAYLLAAGTKAAVTFLHKLGLGVCNNQSLLRSQLEVPSAVLKEDYWAMNEVRRYYKNACLDRLEQKIKYTFTDKSFIVQAVTHSSFSQNTVTDCYQRLEFLGDAVLDYLITGHIYSHYSSYSPGQITDLRSYFVKNETLAKVSADMKLHRHLQHMAPKLTASIDKFLRILDESYEEDTLNTEEDEVDGEDVDVPKALGDLVEAIIGAVYLDTCRSLQRTWEVIEILMGDTLKKSLADIPGNSIRELYEVVNKVKPGDIRFEKVPREENDDTSKYLLKIEGLPDMYGKGKNYRTAKIAAAKLGLKKFQAYLAEQNAMPEHTL
ncbi:hypothetical protein OTU49_005779 [Cherax quadricarinatus]|uniref:Uncharacterized protein n=2 Tax=Cherax quadricarinatus TaxID=27406 RepID=A0AAW0WSK1_CHEQU